MKKALSTVLAIVFTLGLLAGCGGGAASSTGGVAPSAGASTGTAASGEKSDLLLWMPPFGTGDSLDKEFWEKTLQPWAEENNVNLTIEITPWGNYEEKYLTGFSSGNGPDVGYMYLEMYNDFIEMGALEPMDDYFTQEEKDNYLHFDLGFVKGHQYTVPVVVGNARVLFFNMDILEQAGVTELPSTWQELVDVTTKVKNANLDGVLPFAQEWADPAIGALNNLFYPYFWQAGGELYSEDGSQLTLGDGTAALEAAQFLYDMKNTHGVLPDASMALASDDVRAQFAAGNIAVASMDTKSSALLDENNINWDYVASLENQKKATWVAADSLILNSASRNKEKAVELIKFMTSADVMAAFHTEISPFPPITKDEPYNDNPKFEAIYESSNADNLYTLPVAPNSFKMMDTLFKNLQLMMLGELSPEEAIQNTVDYSESLT